MLNFWIFLLRLAFYVVWRTGSASVAKTPKESNSWLQITSNAPTATAKTNATNGPRVRYIMLFKIKTLKHIITDLDQKIEFSTNVAMIDWETEISWLAKWPMCVKHSWRLTPRFVLKKMLRHSKEIQLFSFFKKISLTRTWKHLDLWPHAIECHLGTKRNWVYYSRAVPAVRVVWTTVYSEQSTLVVTSVWCWI